MESDATFIFEIGPPSKMSEIRVPHECRTLAGRRRRRSSAGHVAEEGREESGEGLGEGKWVESGVRRVGKVVGGLNRRGEVWWRHHEGEKVAGGGEDR